MRSGLRCMDRVIYGFDPPVGVDALTLLVF